MRKASLLIALSMVVVTVGLGYLPADSIANELTVGLKNARDAALSSLSSSSSSSSSTSAAFVERQIPVEVTSRITRGVIRRGDPIPLEITIKNGFSGPVAFKSFNLEPNEWNGETPSIALYDIYRGRRAEGLFLARPAVEPPIAIPFMPWHQIPAGKSLTIRTDVRKWTIADGWLPGKYRMALRVDNLQVDGAAALSILGEPIEFEIRN